jgi:folate-binding protein YgfZ
MESPNPSKLIETPLAELHRAAGARMGEWFACALPDDFGDVREEQRFTNESVALIDKNYRAYLTFAGPDRVRYLNAILTNDIKTLPLGHGNLSLLLNPQGRILAEIETYALPDRLLCVSYAMIRARLIEWLEKYIIMDDVTLTDDTEQFGTLALEGPKAADLMRELTATDFAAMPDANSIDTAIRNPRGGSAIPCRLLRRASLADAATVNTSTSDSGYAASANSAASATANSAFASAEFIATRKDLAALWKILEEAARKYGGGPAGYAALSAQRLVQGVPWFGYDFGEKQIPHEAGLQDSHISYTKGCYTGQEIVERVRSRGQVNRRRVGLLCAPGVSGVSACSVPAAETVPGMDAALTLDGAEVGYITRAARSFFPPAVLAMAYVRKEGGALDTVLDCGDAKARVVTLPFALDSPHPRE